jgi:hypothetical protein
MVYHFKLYVELKLFNDQLLFYFGLKSFMLRFINNDVTLQKENFKIILNDRFLIEFFKVYKLINVKDNVVSLFFNEYLTLNAYNYDMFKAYTYFMTSPVIKFQKALSLGRLGYFEYDEMLDIVFFLPYDKHLLHYYIEDSLYFKHYFNVYKFTLNRFFIKDFFNFKNKNEICKYVKVLTFYNKLVYLVFFLLDPFFFKYF